MTRSVADINAEIRGLVDRLGALRAERRVARRREAGIKPHRGAAYRKWSDGGHGADQGGLGRQGAVRRDPAAPWR